MAHINLDHYYWLMNNDPMALSDLEREIRSADKPLVFSMVWEDYDLRELDTTFLPLINKMVQEYVLILTPTAQEQNYTIANAVYVDFFALRTQHKIVEQNTKWNSTATKALFLTGKAEKPHRIGLLSEFYANNMMDRLEWSLHINDPAQYTHLVNTSIDYDKFIADCVRNPDNINIDMQGNTSHYGGFPYDVKLYSDTVLSIVSETDFFGTSSWLTEKTFKAIANKHPFILAANAGTLAKINQLGFKTFENYLPINQYDRLPSRARLDSVVINTRYFLNNVAKHQEQINQDVEHNYLRFQEYCASESAKVDALGVLESFVGNE
jgi:hypothetical protein